MSNFIFFLKNYLILQKFNISTINSIEILRSQKKTSEIGQKVLKNLKKGLSFSKSLKLVSKNSILKEIELGERYNCLDKILELKIKDYEFKTKLIKDNIRNLIYPILSFLLSIICIFVILFILLPELAEFSNETNTNSILDIKQILYTNLNIIIFIFLISLILIKKIYKTNTKFLNF